MTNDEERNRESYVRWQEFAITQLGYTINLFLTLAGLILDSTHHECEKES